MFALKHKKHKMQHIFMLFLDHHHEGDRLGLHSMYFS